MNSELVDKIKAQLYDRASSPVLIAFFVSWITWNIRTVLVIFTKSDLSDKFSAIDKLYPSFWSYPLQGILYPALCALLFVAIYPYLAHLAFWHWQKQHVKIKKTQQRIEDQTPATQEEINALRKTSLEQQIALQDRIRDLSNANKEFTEREKELLNQISERERIISEKNKAFDVVQGTMTQKNQEFSAMIESFDKLKSDYEKLKKINEFGLEAESKNKDLSKYSDEFLNFSENFSINDKQLDDECRSLVNKIVENGNKNNLTIEMLKILLVLALRDGSLDTDEIKLILHHSMSSLEVKNTLNKLKKINFIYEDGMDVRLDETGEEFVVSSGITSLAKKLD